MLAHVRADRGQEEALDLKGHKKRAKSLAKAARREVRGEEH